MENNRDDKRSYSHKAAKLKEHRIHSRDDPKGTMEAEINRLAKRLAHAKTQNNIARILTLKERLISKCLKLFYISGDDTSSLYLEHSTETLPGYDDVFIDILLKSVDAYDDQLGLFTHMLRNHYTYGKLTAARNIAREDAKYGGSFPEAASIQTITHSKDDSTTTLEDKLESPGTKYNSISGVNELDSYRKNSSVELLDELVDEDLILRIISLIASFMESKGKSANDTRKLYTKMFFSESLTRVVKTRSIGELSQLIKYEKQLFSAIELAFQDSYTVEECRTITQLWTAAFAEGIPSLVRPYNDEVSRVDVEPNYGWKLPASVYISYLETLGFAASNALVSQQRTHYENLLSTLNSVS